MPLNKDRREFIELLNSNEVEFSPSFGLSGWRVQGDPRGLGGPPYTLHS
jgi:hypothetical protein